MYEWRTQYHQDPLVGETTAVYYLDVREDVCRDVLDRADVSGSAANAVRATHASQFGAERR